MRKVDKVDQSLTLATIRISTDRYAVLRSAPTSRIRKAPVRVLGRTLMHAVSLPHP